MTTVPLTILRGQTSLSDDDGNGVSSRNSSIAPRAKKQVYSLISNENSNRDDDDLHLLEEEVVVRPAKHLDPANDDKRQKDVLQQRICAMMTDNFVSDEKFVFMGRRIQICNGVESVRFVKFLFLSLLLIGLLHSFVRWMKWENDENFTLHDFLTFDLNHVILDTISFFVISRLYKRRGVDHIFPFLAPLLFGCVYASWCTNIWFLKHSISMYEIFCHWPWQLFVYAVVVIFLLTSVAFLHIQHAIQDGSFVYRLVEILATILFFLLPNAFNPSFHLHHWYLFWMIGMHCNQDYWWSNAAMAFSWGQYINGIAVYGRDPILTCAYSYYVSMDIRCSYMKCFFEDIQKEHNGTNIADLNLFSGPNWRNCSAEGNYIP